MLRKDHTKEMRVNWSSLTRTAGSSARQKTAHQKTYLSRPGWENSAKRTFLPLAPSRGDSEDLGPFLMRKEPWPFCLQFHQETFFLLRSEAIERGGL